ncbi:VIT1/CCC1 transporter family protein [Patescibacteria group bacterium]|nr:VIT1/CCC1 transporter family protein [Patescibacteria group bacterium]
MAGDKDQLRSEEKKKKQYFKLVENKQYQEAEKVWHRLHQGTYIGDLVFGANDGIITTFAVVAGAAGALLSPGIIIILGLANLIADGFSMGASNFLSLRSQRDFVKLQRKKEEWEVKHFPEIEREEIRSILLHWGIPREHVEPATNAITRDEKRWVDLMMREELDLKEEEPGSPAQHGFATFLAFIIAGFFPLIPYLLPQVPNQFLLSSVVAGVAFFGVGAARSLVTAAPPLKAGLEMLLIGGLAAAVAFGIGFAIKTLFGIVV